MFACTTSAMLVILFIMKYHSVLPVVIANLTQRQIFQQIFQQIFKAYKKKLKTSFSGVFLVLDHYMTRANTRWRKNTKVCSTISECIYKKPVLQQCFPGPDTLHD